MIHMIGTALEPQSLGCVAPECFLQLATWWEDLDWVRMTSCFWKLLFFGGCRASEIDSFRLHAARESQTGTETINL